MLNILRKILGITSIKSGVMKVINDKIAEAQKTYDLEVIQMRDKLQESEIESLREIVELIKKQKAFVKTQKENYKNEKANLAQKHISDILSKIM